MKPGSLFDRIFGFLGQLIALNLLWILCSLPIITAGASTTALFYCTLKLHKDGDIRVLHDFFKSFKQNFKQSTLIWILMVAAGIFIYMEKEALATMPGSMSQIFNYVIFAVYIPLVEMCIRDRWNPMCEELKKPWNDEESMDDACKNSVTIMNDAIAEESY